MIISQVTGCQTMENVSSFQCHSFVRIWNKLFCYSPSHKNDLMQSCNVWNSCHYAKRFAFQVLLTFCLEWKAKKLWNIVSYFNDAQKSLRKQTRAELLWIRINERWECIRIENWLKWGLCKLLEASVSSLSKNDEEEETGNKKEIKELKKKRR